MPTVAARYFEAKARPVATLQAPRLAKSSCSFPFDARAKVKNYKHKKVVKVSAITIDPRVTSAGHTAIKSIATTPGRFPANRAPIVPPRITLATLRHAVATRPAMISSAGAIKS